MQTANGHVAITKDDPVRSEVSSPDTTTMPVSLLDGTAATPPLLSGILLDDLTLKRPVSSPQRQRRKRRSASHRRHVSLDSFHDEFGNLNAEESRIQPTLVTLPSRPTEPYQVFDDLSIRNDKPAEKLPPLDVYFEEKQEQEETDDASLLDEDSDEGEKVVMAMHDSDAVDFLVDLCE